MKKNSHIKGRDSMRNCIWLIRKSMKVCPQRLPAMLLVALLDGVNAVNIILFYKYAVQALYQKDVLKQMAIVVLIIGFSLLNCLEFFVFRKMKSSSTINHPLCGCESNVIQKKLPFRVQ